MQTQQHDPATPHVLKRYLSCASPLIVACLLGSTTTVIADEFTPSNDNGPSYAAGLYLGGFGLGVSLSQKTDWSLTNGDQIQWRTSISGLDVDDTSDSDFNGIDYSNIEASLFAVKTGLDWYPYQHGWADEIFFSAGLMYLDSDFNGDADTQKTLNVGGVTVRPGDINGLKTDIEQSGVLPYFSIGWGNKLSGKRGFDFQAELGLAYQTGNTDVTVTANDPNGYLTTADLVAEEKEIKDDIDDLQAFASVTLSYLF